ncbi:zinc ribbon domain-containing protein [Paludibacter sp. 221]|uniref:zinc ribbon domain-containing protein n=1 Tax=Paludibacter sp. 221 TaxID=2302939 RepID=UPI001EF17922|nr:zinc ribbon domain-containing protein [Paludibacter sp. 221]
MALINCIECGKQISDKAISCPNCGVPVAKLESVSVDTQENIESLTFPNLPADLDIGEQLLDWGVNTYFKGNHYETNNIDIPTGEVLVVLYTQGIQIGNSTKRFRIHYSQIISLEKKFKQEVVGTDILMIDGNTFNNRSESGNNKIINIVTFVIKYWDITTKSVKTVLINSLENDKIELFINRYEKEKNLDKTENRVVEKNTTPAWAIICIIVIIVSVLSLFIL